MIYFEKYELSIKIFLCFLFLGCLLNLPYGYFQFVRIAGMACFAFLSYLEYMRQGKLFFLIWIFSALLINPFEKIALGRFTWNFIDILWVLLLLISILFPNQKNKNRQKENEEYGN